MKGAVHGYIVYMRLALTGGWVTYTNPKAPLPLDMAQSLAEHLRRNKTESKIVDAATGLQVAAGTVTA